MAIQKILKDRWVINTKTGKVFAATEILLANKNMSEIIAAKAKEILARGGVSKFLTNPEQKPDAKGEPEKDKPQTEHLEKMTVDELRTFAKQIKLNVANDYGHESLVGKIAGFLKTKEQAPSPVEPPQAPAANP